MICKLYGVEKIRVEANEYSELKVGKIFNFLLSYVTPLLLGITVISNLLKGITNMTIGNLIFGWGTILLMLIFATIFYNKKWEKEV